MNIVLSEETVGKAKVKIQRFPEPPGFETALLKEEQVAFIEELSTRIALMKSSGLVSAARDEEGTLAYYRYCLNNAQVKQDPDYGTKLLDSQLAIIIKAFPKAYQWGWHGRAGDLNSNHIAKYGRQAESTWTYHLNNEDIQYSALAWETFSFGTIPTSVLKKIHQLQGDPIVQQLTIFAPKEAVTDPFLIATCYRIGNRLVARWGEALAPIKGIDC